MLLQYKRKRGCTNKENVCTNDPENLGSKFQNGASIVSPVPLLMLLIYKHKGGCTNEKNTCTNDPESLG